MVDQVTEPNPLYKSAKPVRVASVGQGIKPVGAAYIYSSIEPVFRNSGYISPKIINDSPAISDHDRSSLITPLSDPKAV